MDVSIILPAHNEERRLKANVQKLRSALDPILKDYEIIISEDGSMDKTLEVAKSMESRRLRVFHNGKRAGKGAAIKEAARRCSGEIVVFMDVDLASDPVHVRTLLQKIGKGADIVIGSRYLEKSNSSRSTVRYIASRTFNWLVRNMLGSKLSDHQCGFKAFRKTSVLPVIERIENEKWFWDTELLVRAQRSGLRVAEIPIRWREMPGSRFRLLPDTVQMACALMRIKLRHG